MSDGLPEGWLWTRLDDVCLPVSKSGPRKDRASFRYVDLGAIDNRTKRIISAEVVAVKNAPSRARQVVKSGDVLFSNVRVYLENIAQIPDELNEQIASTAFCVLRPATGVESRFVYHLVTSKPFIHAVNALQRGNSPPSVQDGDVRSQLLPLPPSGEQKRIVSKIDELFSRIEEGERALERVQMLVERYRQSALKAAVTGELTREWRVTNKGKLDSGEALLARILKGRREAWEKSELGKMKAKGQKPANDSWKCKYKEPVPPDTSELPDLPDGWVWATLDQLTSFVTSGSRGWARHYSGEGSLFLRVGNMDRLSIELDLRRKQFVKAPAGSEGERTVTQQQDIVISITADVGMVAVIPESCAQSYVNQHLSLVRPVDRELALWMAWSVASPIVQTPIQELKQGATKDGLTLDDVRAIPVPLASSKEMEEACSKVTSAFSTTGIVGCEVKRRHAESVALRQALLSTAFSGKLVPQERTDEPASLLLERIAAERNGAKTNGSPKRGRKKGTTA